MTKTEAAKLLGVEETAPADELRQQYQKLYNEYRARIDSAPIASLKKTYQEKLQELTSACEVLMPGSTVGSEDFPGSEPSRTKDSKTRKEVLPPPPPPPPPPAFPRSTIVVGAIAVVLIVVLGVIAFGWLRPEAAHEMQPAPVQPAITPPLPGHSTPAVAALSVTAPRAQPASPSLPGTLLISVDDDATVAVDGVDYGVVRPGEAKNVAVSLGKHLVRATSTRADAAVEDSPELKAAGQEVMSIALKERADRSLPSHAAAPVQTDHSGSGPTMLTVAPVLSSVAREQDAALRAAGIQLAAADAAAGDGPRAELVEAAARPGAVTDLGGASMQSCTVELTLSLWRSAQPETWTIAEKGAATGGDPAVACLSARRKAVRSALQKLVAAVRKQPL